MAVYHEIIVLVKELHPVRFAQPQLNRVSRMVRDETLSIFYGSHPFVFQLDDKSTQPATELLTYLNKIGARNTKRIRELYIIYKMRNRARRYIEDKLIPELRYCGIDVDADVAKPVSLPPPFRDDEHSILKRIDQMRAVDMHASPFLEMNHIHEEALAGHAYRGSVSGSSGSFGTRFRDY